MDSRVRGNDVGVRERQSINVFRSVAGPKTDPLYEDFLLRARA